MIKVSDAELEVLKVIWDKKEVNSSEIIKDVADLNWSDNTVRTLIRRLQAKGAIEAIKKDGKSFIYKPLYNREEYRRQATKNLLKKLYHNSAKEMIARLCESGDITAEDLKKVLDQLEDI